MHSAIIESFFNLIYSKKDILYLFIRSFIDYKPLVQSAKLLSSEDSLKVLQELRDKYGWKDYPLCCQVLLYKEDKINVFLVDTKGHLEKFVRMDNSVVSIPYRSYCKIT